MYVFKKDITRGWLIMLDKIMEQFNITNYRYDYIDKTLIIYESILVKDFSKIKQLLKINKCKVENIIIKSRW